MTAKPASLKLYIYRGDPWEISFSSTLDDADETVVAVDALAQIRTTEDSTDVVTDLNVAVDGAVVTLSLTPEETAALPTGTEFVWDFQPDEDSETWLKGAVTIEGDVSRVGS